MKSSKLNRNRSSHLQCYDNLSMHPSFFASEKVDDGWMQQKCQLQLNFRRNPVQFFYSRENLATFASVPTGTQQH